MGNIWLISDLTALDLFEVASEHEDVALLIQEWLDAECDKDKAAIFLEVIELAESLITEIDIDF